MSIIHWFQTRRCNISQVLSPSPHFEIVHLADGVYAAIARNDGAAISNAGIVDTGEHTLVFDTFLTSRAAADLKSTAESITSRQINFIVNSHWHGDHTRGNLIFSPDTEIIASTTTRQLMRTEGSVELHDDIENTPQRLREYEDLLSKETDELKREDLSDWGNYLHQVADSVPKAKLRLPNIVFDGKLVFHGSLNIAELLEMGTGHTLNDSILLLPQSRIAFVSDLLYVESHPYLPGSDPEAWLHILDQLESYHLEKIVPGHGPIGLPGDIILMRQYIQDLLKTVEKLVKQDKSVEAIQRHRIPERYAGWTLRRNYQNNLRYLYTRAVQVAEKEISERT